MADVSDNRFKCSGVPYRAGFVELLSIHENHVNLEVWGVDPDAMSDQTNWVTDLDEEQVLDNVELELDLQQTLLLAELLQRLARMTGNEKSICECNECGSEFKVFLGANSDNCPECSHYLYGQPNCAHSFRDGCCQLCGWNGAVSDRVAKIKGT